MSTRVTLALKGFQDENTVIWGEKHAPGFAWLCKRRGGEEGTRTIHGCPTNEPQLPSAPLPFCTHTGVLSEAPVNATWTVHRVAALTLVRAFTT